MGVHFSKSDFLNYHGDRFNNVVFAFYDNSNLITYITINSENSKLSLIVDLHMAGLFKKRTFIW